MNEWTLTGTPSRDPGAAQTIHVDADSFTEALANGAAGRQGHHPGDGDGSMSDVPEKYLPEDVRAVPRPVRAAILAAINCGWEKEQDDYLNDCSNEPGDNQRDGHPFEAMSRARRWLQGHERGDRVDTEVWIQNPVPEPGGYHTLLRARRKTVQEVYRELAALLGEEHDGFTYVTGAEEYFDVSADGSPHRQWPAGRIACFAVTGGSEGHYVHVRVIGDSGASDGVILGKTFEGLDAAWALARRLGDILGV